MPRLFVKEIRLLTLKPEGKGPAGTLSLREALVGAIFVVSSYLASVGRCTHSSAVLPKPAGIPCHCVLQLPHESQRACTIPILCGYLVKARGHTQGAVLQHLALVAMGTRIPESHRTNNPGVSSWHTATPRALHRSRRQCSCSLPVKRTYLFVLELQPEGQTSSLPFI